MVVIMYSERSISQLGIYFKTLSRFGYLCVMSIAFCSHVLEPATTKRSRTLANAVVLIRLWSRYVAYER